MKTPRHVHELRNLHHKQSRNTDILLELASVQMLNTKENFVMRRCTVDMSTLQIVGSVYVLSKK